MFAPASRKLKCEPIFRLNAEDSLREDLSTRLAIIELVVELIARPPRRSIIAGSWMQSRGVNLGSTGRRRRRGCGREGVGREAEVAVPKLVCATPYKVLRNLFNQLRRDPNSDSTTYTITKIKT